MTILFEHSIWKNQSDSLMLHINTYRSGDYSRRKVEQFKSWVETDRNCGTESLLMYSSIVADAFERANTCTVRVINQQKCTARPKTD